MRHALLTEEWNTEGPARYCRTNQQLTTWERHHRPGVEMGSETEGYYNSAAGTGHNGRIGRALASLPGDQKFGSQTNQMKDF